MFHVNYRNYALLKKQINITIVTLRGKSVFECISTHLRFENAKSCLKCPRLISSVFHNTRVEQASMVTVCMRTQ